MGKIIGIDLGTSYSAAAVMINRKPTLIPDPHGNLFLPSVVAVNADHELLVGRKAKDQAILNPKNTISSVKRLLGHKFDDPEIIRSIYYLPFEVSGTKQGDLQILMDNKHYSPEEITAILLAKLKKNAEAFLNEAVSQAVITVPAVFNSFQRKAIMDSCKIAGLQVMRIISESTAFSLVHHFGKKEKCMMMVVDMGGGFISTSIIDIGDGVWQVASTSGDNTLGGDEFDQRVMEAIIKDFKKEQRIDLGSDRQALGRLKEAAEKTRVELSSLMETEINLPCICADASGLKNLQMKVTRSRLEQLTDELINRALIPVEQALRDANLRSNDIDKVVLVGGLMRMPRIQELVRQKFRSEPHQDVKPKELVALGAAIQAGVLNGEETDVFLLDVAPMTLSIASLGGVATALIQRNATIPTHQSNIFSTTKDGQTEVDIHILEGERPMAADNRSLGHFMLDGIPPALKGIAQIEVSFDIDANGVLLVSARDKATGRSQKVTLSGAYGLSPEEIEQSRIRIEELTSWI
jgi:molecular chaperone DnaK